MRPKRKILKPIENKSVGIGVVSLATYTSPKIVEVRNQDWINYGEDNNYFGYLQDRINGSPTNNAIVNGISQMIFGQGLDSTEKLIKPDEWAEVQLLFDNDTVERLGNDLEAMGNCAIQVVYSIDRTRILECNHFPVETLRSGKCNEDGDIEFYYYAEDWTKVTRQKPPLAIPAFGTSSESEEILYIKPYKTGFYYYSPVSFQGCLQYCEIEEEVSNFHLNNILNGMAPSMLINFLNGIPTETEQREIERNIQNKFSGTSNAGKFILNFSDGANTASTITPIQLSDAHNQYQFLADEAMRKIMVGHRIISPMLLGIKDNSGFGNNADELQTATILMQNTVIKPVQNLLIKHYYKILAYNKNTIKLYVKNLQPLTADNELTIEAKPTDTTLSKHEDCFNIDSFDGETVTEEWELVDKREYNNENLDIENWANNLIKPKKGVELKDFINSKPSAESYLDKGTYKVRYEYSQKYSSGNSRNFCVNMMARTTNGVVYRKEDIDQASFQGVNNEFGHEKQNYSLFEFKGGVNCGHFWSENLYRLKTKTDGTPYKDKALSSSEEVDSISGYNPTPKGLDNAKKAPIDMDDEGHHPAWVAKHRG